MKQIPILGLVAAVGLAQVADAAGNTPINTPARAARSALYALELPNTISQRVNDDDYGARNIIEKGFDLLEAATTVEALLASPRGIVVPCPSGGTLTTRMSRSVPRLVTFDWADCKQTDLVGQVYSQTGPAEVVMTEASFRPKTLYSLRLGNGARDHVESHPRMPNVAYGEFVVRRNQRFTGVIQQREFDWQDVPGGTYELTGFVERTLMLPDRNAGQPPSTELYPYVTYTYADHALLSRERTSGYDANQVWSYHEDIVFAWGLLGSRNDVPARPNKPATSTTDEYRGFGLRAQNSLGGPPGGPGSTVEFDGKLQVLRYDSRGLGCTSPEAFTYRTVVPMTTPPEMSIGFAYDAGAIEVNGSTRLAFTGLPSQDGNIFSAKSQLDITAPGLSPMRFVVDPFVAEQVRAAAVCK
ncbi:MAG TPA: hypothetical protein VJP84_03940 [Steroidobacteraceae bacterium]|nr:hypothetical protein [Steroidobacteraceae bacterium]